MKIFTGLTILVLALGLGIAIANAANCSGVITVQSTARNAITSATDGAKFNASYKREFAAARDQALARWSAKVSTSCPGKSHFWIRARDKKIEECDRAMGGRLTVCVSGVPAKRVF
ncbi:MAG: hypothetical protein ABL901_05640 [Hyphomicrobiaceae bacterium]